MLPFNLSLLFALLFLEQTQSRFSRVPPLSGDFSRVEKRESGQGYFEQCRDIDLPRRRLGYVNVFAFLDASWHYSYRQAVMLRLLKNRLEKAGFPDIRFFVVVAPPGFPDDKTEDATEIEAWMGISMMESQDFPGPQDVPAPDFDKTHGTPITFIQDSPELGIWGKLRVSKNEVIIVDRCGKLTYQVIVPWSILYFPYVKAAILFTYNEDPCGPCDVQFRSEDESTDYEDKVRERVDGTLAEVDFSSPNEENEKLLTAEDSTPFSVDSVSPSTSGSEENERIDDSKTEELKAQRVNGVLPLRIIMRAPHVHPKDETHKKYKYLILKIDSPEYHGHLDNEKNVILSRNETGRSFKGQSLNKTVLDVRGDKNVSELVYDKDESPGLYGEVADYWKNYDDDYYMSKNETVEANADYNDATDADSRNNVGSPDDLQNGVEPGSFDSDRLLENIDAESDESTQSISEIINLKGAETVHTDSDTAGEASKEEELRRKLLDHYYYKLLPWIHYGLDK